MRLNHNKIICIKLVHLLYLNVKNFFAGSCFRKTVSLDSEPLSEHRIRRNEHSSYSGYVTTAG